MGAHPDESVPAVAVEHDEHRGGHEPDEELASDEPRTPMWLPLVGGIVFVLGIASFMATRPPGKTAAELRKEAAAAAAELRARQAPEPAPAIAAPPPQPGGVPNPAMPQPGRAPGRGG